MSRIQTFAQQLQMSTAGLSGPAADQALAAFARQELAKVLSSGEGSPIYDRYVNGIKDQPESAVRVPGPILYVFRWWTDIVEFALQTLIERSPNDSGLFKRSWFVMVNGSPISDFKQIRADATVVITNDQPYSRKIEVGHMKMSVPHGVVEDSLRKVKGLFGNMIKARAVMVNLPNAYILKGRFSKGYRKFARRGLRRDTMAGARMTYPAMILEMRT